MSHSLVQIFGVSSTDARDLITHLLSDVPDIEVGYASSRLGVLVTTACRDESQAVALRQFVRSIDSEAHLIFASDDVQAPHEELAAC